MMYWYELDNNLDFKLDNTLDLYTQKINMKDLFDVYKQKINEMDSTIMGLESNLRMEFQTQLDLLKQENKELKEMVVKMASKDYPEFIMADPKFFEAPITQTEG